MPENRPQGRKTKVSGQSTGAYRRGEGQNTGPVGSAGSNPNRPSRPAGQGMSRAAKAGGGGGILIVIIFVLIMLFKGGGLGGLLGGGDDSALSGGSAYNDVSANPYGNLVPGGSGSGSGSGSTSSSANPYANLLAGASYSGSAQEVNSGAVDTSVASGARDKYTRILGNQRDEVTILIYMCGTDLESRSGMATKDLTEMTRATIGPNVHVLVYTGGCARWNNSVISSRQNQIYEVQSGGLKRVVDNDGTGAMTDPATLTRFIQWGAKNYPANRYMLILWDHGGGSVSGYGYDENNKRSGSMPLEGIDRALKAGGIQFDIVGFDACLMATVETGLMLEPYADYMIASEETEPGIGWYYTDWLTKLSNNTSMPSVDIGKNIVDDFVRTCSSQCPGQSATLSVVDIAELSATVP
ncbi:MAG: peptidase C11, partial [Oscillospiraceae bacterium]|nr:peptidase C11 [Oscillospiraceae bacterium]